MIQHLRFSLKVMATIVFMLGVSCSSLNGNRMPAASEDSRDYHPASIRYLIWNSPITDPNKLPKMKFIKQVKPKDAEKLIAGIKKIQDTIVMAFKPADNKSSISEYTPAQIRYRTLLIMARSRSTELFKELRHEEPVFFLPGDDKEKPTYLLARYKDVDESFGAVGVPPKNLAVIYTDTMDKTLPGQYMLSGEGNPANKEKPMMLEFVGKAPSHDGSLSSKEMQKRVRELTKYMMYEMMRTQATDASIDIAPYASRNIPLGLVSDYFGFYPPDLHTQIQWSRNTQNAFFHNPMNVEGLNKLSMGSGQEMQAYIKMKLMPELQAQLEHGRPAYDTVARMLAGHAQFADSYGASEKTNRIVGNVMGLLVGAGETSTLAVVRSIKQLLDRPEIYKAAVAAAKKADKKGASEKDIAAFDHFVWEALRFQPINPWVERRAINNFTVTAVPEQDSKLDKLKSMILSPKDVEVTKNSRVLVAMESAMMDSEKYPKPEEFNLNRDLDSYFHMSFDYHSCLGIDVAKVFVPEIVKQILVNFDDLSYTTPEGALAPWDNKGSPFPESWVLKFKKKSRLVSVKPVSLPTAKSYLASNEFATAIGAADSLTFINSYLKQSENPERVMISIPPHRIDLKGMMEKDAHMKVVQAKMFANEKMLSGSDTCKNSMLTEDLRKDGQSLFCGLPYKFRACYFLQRTAGQKTTQHAFNQCAFGESLLTAEQFESTKKTLGVRTRAFEFLTYM